MSGRGYTEKFKPEAIASSRQAMLPLSPFRKSLLLKSADGIAFHIDIELFHNPVRRHGNSRDCLRSRLKRNPRDTARECLQKSRRFNRRSASFTCADRSSTGASTRSIPCRIIHRCRKRFDFEVAAFGDPASMHEVPISRRGRVEAQRDERAARGRQRRNRHENENRNTPNDRLCR